MQQTPTKKALLSALFLLLLADLATAQTIVQSFEGDRGPDMAACEKGPSHCGRQPEMNAAANGKQVVQVTWQSVRVHDYQGKLLQSTPMADFIRKAGLDPMAKGGKGPFEPHVVFNEFIGRWIITSTCKDDCLLVSASADPMGAWGGVNLSCQQGGECLDTNPGLKIGYDKNGIYYCGGHHGDENPGTVKGAGYDCFAVPREEVKDIAQGKPPAHINRIHNMPLDVVPAIDQNPDKAPGAPAFFMNKSCDHAAKANACQRSEDFPFEWIVNTFTWNGPIGTYNVGASQQSVKTDIGSKSNKWLYNTPCCGANASIPQAGSETVRLRAAGSHRLMNVVQFGSHLHGVLGSGPCTGSACGVQGTDTNNLMFYVDLDCSNSKACVVSQTAKISGGGFNPEFGTVGVDKQGNVGILAMSATATTHLGLLSWARRKTDPPNVFKGPATVLAGTKPHTCMPKQDMVHLGSTVGIPTVRDPLDGTKLWTSLQWSNDATPCVFNTRIIEYQIK
jgi:hypothetical protein